LEANNDELRKLEDENTDSIIINSIKQYRDEIEHKMEVESNRVKDICNKLHNKWKEIVDLRKERNFTCTPIYFK